jgi:hypothetical protein
MKYIFDSGPLIDLFRRYYPKIFPSLWVRFHALVSEEKIISVREVYHEIEAKEDALSHWAKEQKDTLFLPSTVDELRFVNQIFQIQHFQAMIRKQERLQGKPVADPFVIARAKIHKCQVVTTELFKDKAAGIPNVCEHFSIPYINLEGFMQQENWVF